MSERLSDSASRTQIPDGFDGPRACGPLELAGALDLANLVLRTLSTPPELTPRWPTIGYDYPHIYHCGNLDNIRVIVRDGRVVTSVAIYSTTVRTPRGDLRVGGINAMVTHPEFRRLGLGRAVMEDAAQKMRQDGHQVGFIGGTYVHDWYRHLGWENAGERWRFVLDRGNIGYLPDPAGFEIVDNWQPHFAELYALYSGGRHGAVRSEIMYRLLAQRKLSRIFIALRDGHVAAYVGVRGTAVNEYAGATDDVARLIRAAFDRLDDPSGHTSEYVFGQRSTIEVTVTTPPESDGLPGLLANLGIPSTRAYLGLINILDAPGLFHELRLGELDLQPHGQAWRVRHGQKVLDLTRWQLVKAVFGPERFLDFASGILPVPFFQWQLDFV